MKCAVAIFAKTIGLSPVKTRLAKTIGEEKAEAFYRLSVNAIEAVAQTASQQVQAEQPLVPHWALGEEAATALAQWQNFPAIWTGEGGLGSRLARLSEVLFEDHDAVMFIGTDSPHISPEIFEQAIAVLAQNPDDCVVGPACDGGFYLFVTRKPVSRDVWEAVTYSVDTTLQDLQDRSNRTFHALAVEQDVDVFEDLDSLMKTLQTNQDSLLPQQQKLLNWLKQNAVQ